jgi:hypothetical protein
VTRRCHHLFRRSKAIKAAPASGGRFVTVSAVNFGAGLCARLPPAPFPMRAKDENGRQGRAYQRALRRRWERRAVALRPQKRPRLPFAANLL